MTMRAAPTPVPDRPPGPISRRTVGVRLAAACALGVGAALLVACGSSGKGLIPSASAGPLQADFEAVGQAAQNANGNCSATEAAIAKTEQDFNALPTSIDPGLRTRLREGITNLSKNAREICAQPLASTTTTGTTATTTTTPTATVTTPTDTQTTPPTTPTTTTPTTSTGPGGGTVAPPDEPPAGGPGGGTGAGEGGNGGVGAEGGK
jgi:hypothetical protein